MQASTQFWDYVKMLKVCQSLELFRHLDSASQGLGFLYGGVLLRWRGWTRELLGDGQREGKTRAMPLLALHPNLATVGFHQSLGNG